MPNFPLSAHLRETQGLCGGAARRSVAPLEGGLYEAFPAHRRWHGHSLHHSHVRVARFVERHENHLVIPMRLDTAGDRCPECGQASPVRTSRYHRHPAICRCRHRRPSSALRCGGSTAQPDLPTPNLRRDAHDPSRTACPAHAAAWRGAGQGRPRLRRCRRRASSRALHMPASRAIVLRLVTRLRCPMRRLHPGRHRRLGDQEGQRYGTIVVDLDRHRVVDLLPDRTAPTVAGWLKRHPASNSSPGIARRSIPRYKPRRSPGAACRRSLAPAHQHPAGPGRCGRAGRAGRDLKGHDAAR